MKEIFGIRTYELVKNVTFKTFESIGIFNIIKKGKNSYGDIFETERGTFESNRHVKYSLEKTSNMFDYNDKLLPYFANVIQDLPASVKFEPEVYPNCQLMTEKHGGYLQFWDSVNKEKRRIALNSHDYKPLIK